jgi:hypothetical protein
MPGDPKINVYFAYDKHENQMWAVDDLAKLPAHLVRVAIAGKPLRLEKLKALVYDSERDNTVCFADVSGWKYDTRRAQAAAKGLFAYSQLVPIETPADQ